MKFYIIQISYHHLQRTRKFKAMAIGPRNPTIVHNYQSYNPLQPELDEISHSVSILSLSFVHRAQ